MVKDFSNKLAEQAILKMNLVSREEFDVQTEVLLKTRSKLEELELIVKKLEEQNV